HLYSLENIQKAIGWFESITRNATDPGLRLLSRAGLARCSAMMVLFDSKAGKLAEASVHFQRALNEGEAVLADIDRQTPPLDKNGAKEIRWRVLNGRGVAYMFHSDYVTDWTQGELE